MFANHRERQASWYYIILNLANIEEKGIRGNILGMLSNYLDNPTVFWKSKDYTHYQLSAIRVKVKEFINELFTVNRKGIIMLFKRRDCKRFISVSVFFVLNEVNGIHDIIYQLSLEENLELDERNNLFLLYIHFGQHRSEDKTISAINEFLIKHPDNDEAYLFEGIKETIIKDGYIQTG